MGICVINRAPELPVCVVFGKRLNEKDRCRWDFRWALVDVDTTLKPTRFLCGNPASGNGAYDDRFLRGG